MADAATKPVQGAPENAERLDFQTSLRLTPDLVTRTDAIGQAMRESSGFPAKRSTVIRMAIERGIDALERDYIERPR